MDSQLHIVIRREVHYLPTCPCSDCQAERERRATIQQTPSEHLPIRQIPVSVAFVLGYLPARSPLGSVARGISSRQTGLS